MTKATKARDVRLPFTVLDSWEEERVGVRRPFQQRLIRMRNGSYQLQGWANHRWINLSGEINGFLGRRVEALLALLSPLRGGGEHS
jgi:hypothetical protein